MKQVAVLSLHKGYDYRIERHIKTLLKLGYKVNYYNITNEKKSTFRIDNNNNVKYYKIYINSKKNILGMLSAIIKIYTRLLKDKNDIYFIQDPIIAYLFTLSKKEKSIACPPFLLILFKLEY